MDPFIFILVILSILKTFYSFLIMELKNIRKQPSNNYDQDDLAQECAAYMKTKLFMAKRIAEQQAEIEQLKEEVLYHSMKHSQLYEIISVLTNQVGELKKAQKGKELEKLDLSEEFTNSLLYEEERNNENFDQKTDKKIDEVIMLADNNIIRETLMNENLMLRKELEFEKAKNLTNNSVINKLVNDKFVLFTELNELLLSLKKVDIETLNNFYNTSLLKSRSLSSIGLKYNILSAQSEIALLLQPLKDIATPLPDPILKHRTVDVNHLKDVVKRFEQEIAILANEKIIGSK